MTAKPKLKDDGILLGRKSLLTAQVEVNRAVSLLNASVWSVGASYLDPVEYSDAAIDAKILQAIDALESALAHPRSRHHWPGFALGDQL